jgi:hypothetical protein
VLQLVSAFADQLVNCRHFVCKKTLAAPWLGKTEREIYRTRLRLQAVFVAKDLEISQISSDPEERE